MANGTLTTLMLGAKQRTRQDATLAPGPTMPAVGIAPDPKVPGGSLVTKLTKTKKPKKPQDAATTAIGASTPAAAGIFGF